MEQLPEFLTQAVEFLDDRKAENITIIDLREVANVADYFVVATAANAPHLKALGDGMQRLCKNERYRESRHAGDGNSGWVIADYDGVMVHVFSFEMRNLYDLEKLWKDAKRIELQTAAGRGWREATAENEVNDNIEQGITNSEG